MKDKLLRIGVEVFHLWPAVLGKNWLRAQFFRPSSRFHRAALIDRGDDAVIVGTPAADHVNQLAKYTSPDGTGLIFEPAPENYRRLNERARYFDRVTVREIGVWSSEDTVKLQGASEYPADYKIDVNGITHDNDFRNGAYTHSTEIKVAPLDTLIEREDIRPDYLEIMVNGVEMEVLRGAVGTLRKYRPRLWVKGHALNRDGTPLNRDIKRYLQQQDYKVVISKGGQPTVGDINGWDQRAGDVFAFPR